MRSNTTWRAGMGWFTTCRPVRLIGRSLGQRPAAIKRKRTAVGNRLFSRPGDPSTDLRGQAP
jgi:hypothetical protein